MGRHKERKGIILPSKFLKHLCSIMYRDECFLKEEYLSGVSFFNQVLKQELEERDKMMISQYFSGFKHNHASRLRFWEENEPYRRRENNGRTK